MKKFIVVSSDSDSVFNHYNGEPEIFDDASKLTKSVAEDIAENDVTAGSYKIYEIVGEFRYTPPTDTGTLTPVQEK